MAEEAAPLIAVRVATYNVYMFYNPLSTISKVIQRSGADVIALQEVLDDGTISALEAGHDCLATCRAGCRATRRTKLQWLALNLGMHCQYADSGYGFGNAILSRYPIQDFVAYRLVRHGSMCEARVMLMCLIEPHPGVHLRVHTVHLDHVEEELRLIQIKHARDFIEEAAPDHFDLVGPHILCGDFNSLNRSDYDEEKWNVITETRRVGKWPGPVSDVMDWLFTTDKEKASPTYIDGRCAAMAVGPVEATCRFNTRIDYILLSQSLLGEEWTVVPGSYYLDFDTAASDHALVSVKIAFTGRTSACK